jgi:YidC/Oxa1 family membrane protein insertase
MESGRFLLAVVLMIAVVVVTNLIFPPARPTAPATSGDTTSLAAPPPAAPTAVPGDTTAPAVVGARPPAPADTADPGALAAAEPADTIWIDGPLWRYGISTRGGGLVWASTDSIMSYAEPGEPPAQLVPEGASLIGHLVSAGGDVIDLSTLSFQPSVQQLDLGAGDPGTLRLSHEGAGGLGIQIDYTFDPSTFVYDVALRVRGAGAATPQLAIQLGPTLRVNDAQIDEDRRALAFVVNSTARGIESRALRDIETELVVNGPLTWVALKNKYFLAAVLQQSGGALPFGGVIARPTGEPFAVNLAVTAIPDPEGTLSYRVYVGPQDTEHLSAVGQQLIDVNTFGWKFLQPILRPLGHAIIWALVGMHDVLGLAYGWVLVLFGVIIRIVLWPLNAKAMRSQMKNMEVQPKLKEIQTRYKNEPERLQKEMLRLYKEEGFNPMGGCLPMLIPFPILITLFFVFQSTIEFRGVSFLWLPDLSLADPFYVLPVLLGASMFALQFLSMRTAVDQNPQMKFMMYFMPLFMTVIFLNFASGLNLYYAAMNVASVPQQLQIMKERKRWHASREPAPAAR